MSARNVPEILLDRVARTPNAEAFRSPQAAGGWASLTWAQVGARVRAIAAGLRALGVAAEERCAIMSATRVEWVLCDLGILVAGGATTTIYPSTTEDETAYILKDSATVVAFVENAQQLAKVMARRSELPLLRKVVLIDAAAGTGAGDWALSLAELERLGLETGEGDVVERARAIRPEALATLIYTSGTTGRPKGVELTHDSWVYEAEAVGGLGILFPDDIQYLWLPLAHSFGKVLEVVQLHIGFVTAIDGRVDKLVANLADVRPTFVALVPRILEKVHGRIVTVAAQGSPVKRRLFGWAMRVGHEVSKARQAGREPSAWLALSHRLADRLVLAKLRARFGGRLRFAISGSAPLARDIAEFCHAFGLLVLEGYGLTESSAATCVNLPTKYRFGAVGPVLAGTQVRLADDGEILLKGRGIMRGYRGLPEATFAALGDDGWLRTGDIGVVGADGMVQITDRKKDLIKTAGGKYVAPQSIEGQLKAICPYVSQVVVHGDRRPYCTALLTLDSDAIKAWAGEHGLAERPLAELAAEPEVRALVDGYMKQLNAGLARHETVKRYTILAADLTLEAGELTPSLKVKRRVVEERYRDRLDSLYAGAVPDEA